MTPRTAPPPRHESRWRNWRGRPLTRRRGGQARHRRSRRRSRGGSRHGGQRGPEAIGPRDGNAIPDPLGSEALPLVMEVYGWLRLATSGTTRGLRNWPFDAVLLLRDGGNRVVPPGRWVAGEDQERALQAVVRAGWPD